MAIESLAPLRLVGESAQARQYQRGDAVRRWGRRILHRLGTSREVCRAGRSRDIEVTRRVVRVRLSTIRHHLSGAVEPADLAGRFVRIEECRRSLDIVIQHSARLASPPSQDMAHPTLDIPGL